MKKETVFKCHNYEEGFSLQINKNKLTLYQLGQPHHVQTICTSYRKKYFNESVANVLHDLWDQKNEAVS